MENVKNLLIMQEWVQQYKDDEVMSVGQASAIKAMEHMLVAMRNGIDKVTINAMMAECRRTVEILQAFQGRMVMLHYQMTGILEEEIT